MNEEKGASRCNVNELAVGNRRLPAIALITSCLIAGCGQMAPGSDLAYVEPIDAKYSYIGTEMNIALNYKFRPSAYILKLDSMPSFGEKKYVTDKGLIPMASASIKGRDMCNRQKNPYCKGIAFGEELNRNPQVLADMTEWFSHVCERLPVTVTEKTSRYSSLNDRQRAVSRLREFMGCDGSPKELRDIHVYVVRNFDEVFNGDLAHTDAVLKQSIISEGVIEINQ